MDVNTWDYCSLVKKKRENKLHIPWNEKLNKVPLGEHTSLTSALKCDFMRAFWWKNYFIIILFIIYYLFLLIYIIIIIFGAAIFDLCLWASENI